VNTQQRHTEIARLREAHKSALAQPLMSEGNISPAQVGMFSLNQKRKWQALVQEKMAVEAVIRHLSKSDEELARENYRQRLQRAKGEAVQIHSMRRTIASLGQMSHRADGTLKPSYQRTIDADNARLEQLVSEFPDLNPQP
jgi:hypothetical protein